MMTSPVLMLLTPLLAVTFGYKPSTDSNTGYDYTVQVEPELVEQMQRGNADSIEFDIPPEVTPIRKIRVIVGSGPLEKKLRPDAHTTFRQDLDSASIGLLAQTGPAGGYGRGARGFNTTSTRAPATTPSNPAPITVPSIGTTQPLQPIQPTQPTLPSELQRSIDASFQATETGINNTANSVNSGVNNVSAATQQAIDDARRTMNQLPNDLQQDFRNTTDAMRSSIDQATGVTTTTNPAANPAWSSTTSTPSGGRSVLVQPTQQNNPAAASATTTRTQAEQDYWDSRRREQLMREQQLREQQARLAESTSRTRLSDTGFPQQSRLESVPARSNQPTLNDPRLNVVESIGDTSLLRNVNNNGTGPTSISADRLGNAGQPNNAGETFTSNAGVVTLPSIGKETQTPTNQQTNPGQPNVSSWSPQDDETPKESSGLPYGVLAWAVAFGLGFVNLFQWLNLVDMRNKYRVALRRSSPNFSRSMAA